MQVGELKDVQSAKKDRRKSYGRDERIVHIALMEIGLYYWIYVYILYNPLWHYTFSHSRRSLPLLAIQRSLYALSVWTEGLINFVDDIRPYA